MDISDMRRDIVITDSDDKTEDQTSQVGADILAFKLIPTFDDLRNTVIFRKPSYKIVKSKNQFEIQIFEDSIDKRVREDGYVNRNDYSDQFKHELNRSIKSGLQSCLTSEKLGIQDQILSYATYLGYFSRIPPEFIQSNFHLFQPHDLIGIPFLSLVANAMHHLLHRSSDNIPPNVRRSLKELILPIVPVDKWITGSSYLFFKGNRLIK